MRTNHISRYSIFTALLLFLTTAYGQEFVLTGRVIDSLTSEGLEYTVLYNHTSGHGAQCNASGYFRLQMAAGTNRLTLTHTGCSPRSVLVQMTGNMDTILLMSHHLHEVEDVTISAEKNKLMVLQKDRLAGQDILISGYKPLSSILGQMPGVHTLNSGFSIGKPVVQGMYGSRVATFNNGVRQEDQQWGQEHGLIIDPNSVGSATLIKGAEALRYTGDGIGGVIVLDQDPFPDRDSIFGLVSGTATDNGRQGLMNLSQSLVRVGKRTGTQGLRIQFSAKRAGTLQTPDHFMPNTGFSEQNAGIYLQPFHKGGQSLQASFSWFHSRPGILSTSHFGNLSDLERAIRNELPVETGSFSYRINRPMQDITHWTGRVAWNRDILNGFRMTWIYGLQNNRRKEFDSHNYFNKTAPSMDLKLITHQTDLLLTRLFNNNLLIKTGMNAALQTNEYEGRFFIPNCRKTEGHLFGIARYKKNRHDLEAGFRSGLINMDIYQWENGRIARYQPGFNGTSWTLGWLWNVYTDWQVSAGTGQIWRNPNLSEMFSNGLHHGAASIEYGNRNLSKETATFANLSFKYKHNRTHIELEGFYKAIQGYIYLQPKIPAELTIRGAFPAFEYKQTDAVFTGFDLFAEQRLGRSFYITEKAGYVQVKDMHNQAYLNNIPPLRASHTLRYVIREKKIIKNGEMSLTAEQAARQGRYTAGTDYTSPPDGYMLWHCQIRVTLNQWPECMMYISGQNLLNKTYRNYMNRFRYFSDEPGRMLSFGFIAKIP